VTDVIEYLQRRKLVLQTLEQRTSYPEVATTMRCRAQELESLIRALKKKECFVEQF
jgi:hypothetical protein